MASQHTPAPVGARTRSGALLIAVTAFAVYTLIGTHTPSDDTLGNLHLPLAMLRHGEPLLRLDEFPWARQSSGALQYFVLETRFPGKLASTFGIGAPLTALPAFAIDQWLNGPATPARAIALGKVVAAACMAATAALIFLIAARTLSRARALLVAAVFAFATCAWGVGSQALWQQSPNILYLTLGAYCLCRWVPNVRYSPSPAGRVLPWPDSSARLVGSRSLSSVSVRSRAGGRSWCGTRWVPCQSV